MANRKDRARFRIGDLLVQPDRLLVITDDGREIPLEPRMMDVLVALAENAGQTLSANRLLIDIWIHEFYGDNPVHKAIAQLRKAIGDDSRAPRYIETIRKRGYRLIAPVTFPEDYRRSPRQSDAWTNGSPYVGLVPFDETHAGVFFGRNRMTAELLAAMRSQIDSQRRFVLIVGASGCGKTSLLRAGAVPLLTREGGFDGMRTLSIAHCDLAAMHAGDAMTALAAALTSWTLDGRPVFPPQPLDDMKKLLIEKPESISRIIEETFRRHIERGLYEQTYAHLLLTIDHAESLVATSLVGPETLTAFSRALQSLCDSPRTLVTMIARSDFYPKLIEAMPELTERKAGDGHLDVLIPRQGEIAEIIRKPGILAGLTFEEDPQTLVHLDDVLRDAALAQPDALPLLQHTLQALYERRNAKNELTFAAYREIGGLEGAIAHRANEVFAALPEGVQSRLDSVLEQLIVIQSDSDAISARQGRMNAIGEHARELVHAFVGARLFVGGLSNGIPSFGVTHEALLRQWPRASEWTQDNRRLLQAQARLSVAATRWAEEGRSPDHLLNDGRPLFEAKEAAERFADKLGKDERDFLFASDRMHRHKRRIRQAFLMALAIFALTASILAALAFNARNEAERRRLEAQRLANYLVDDLALALRSRGDQKLLEGISTEALAYLEGRDLGELNQKEATNLSLALSLAGETAMNKGETEAARSAFMRARDTAIFATKFDQKSTKALFAIGLAEYGLGKEQYDLGNHEEAAPHWEEYLRIGKRLAEIEPQNPTWIAELSQAHGNLGAIATQHGKHQEAIDTLLIAVEQMDKAISRDSRRDDWRFQKAVLRSWIARNEESLGMLTEASYGYAASIALLHGILSRNPEAKDWEQQLTSFLISRSHLELEKGNVEEADGLLQDCILRLRKLAGSEPLFRGWRYQLANANSKAAEIALLRGNHDEYSGHIITASVLMRELAPLKKNELRLDATILFLSGKIDSSAKSQQKRDRAISDLEAIAAGNPGNISTNHALANALIFRGRHHLSTGHEEAARKDWARAIAVLGENAEKSKDTRLLAPWVSAHLLLGQQDLAKRQLDELHRMGYAHPDFNRIRAPMNTLRLPTDTAEISHRDR